jgi:hypothetical protein
VYATALTAARCVPGAERLLRAYDQGPTSLNVNANIVRQRFEDFADIISQVSTRQGDDAMADLG